jgi:hypothetical protein
MELGVELELPSTVGRSVQADLDLFPINLFGQPVPLGSLMGARLGDGRERIRGEKRRRRKEECHALVRHELLEPTKLIGRDAPVGVVVYPKEHECCRA